MLYFDRRIFPTSGVSSPHPAYLELFPTWVKMRDAIAGERLIKGRLPLHGDHYSTRERWWSGERYLPRLYQQDEIDYVSYRDRATWLEATSRTLQFYLALIFRKPVKVETSRGGSKSTDMPRWARGAAGASFHVTCQEIARDFIAMGRVILVPDTTDDGQARTVAQREADGVGAYLSWYRPEQLINWRWDRAKRLTLAVLREGSLVAGNASEFTHEEEVIYRVFRLREGGATVEVMREDGTVVEQERAILIGGEPMQELPVRIVDAAPDSLTSPLEGIVNLNIAHYRNSASYENALHHAGAPTPYLAGWDETGGGAVFLGSHRAIVSANPDFKAGYLEMHGHGLNPLQEALNDKRRDMANLGARLLMDQARFNEAAETVLMRKAGEQSTIGQLAQQLDIELSWCLSHMARIEGEEVDVRVRLNRDLMPASISHQMVVALMNLQISGNLSKRMLFERLKDGEIVDSEADFEDLQKEVQEDQEAEAERLMTLGEQQLLGRHADRQMPDSLQGDPENEHGRGTSLR